ncbi:circadian clock-controlled protein daywake-like [Vanessa cardui]|uniref:circadian clock-controlled protein daywake-like n=1 Tax=Vanessa cardui TaxID=171605 RepID=UPI001F12F994|nr:circadian clock-controlled protein daywake-like [Vanessa cardui]
MMGLLISISTYYTRHEVNLYIYIFLTEGFKIPCSDSSSECLKQSLQVIIPEFIHGIPELNITSLDPFEVDSLVLKLSGDIVIEFKEAYTKGLQKCIVDYVRQLEEETFYVQFECNLISKGKYRSSGSLFTFPINGEGQSTIKTRSLKIRSVLHLSPVTKEDGKNYVQIINVKTTHAFGGRVIYNMTNLIKGNPEMSRTVLDFMNKNWQIVAEEFGSPIVEYCINSILDNLKKLFNAVPLSNLLIT